MMKGNVTMDDIASKAMKNNAQYLSALLPRALSFKGIVSERERDGWGERDSPIYL